MRPPLLAGIEHLPHLTRLDLSANVIVNDAELAVLNERLVCLVIDRSVITGAGIDAIVRRCPWLERLSVRATPEIAPATGFLRLKAATLLAVVDIGNAKEWYYRMLEESMLPWHVRIDHGLADASAASDNWQAFS